MYRLIACLLFALAFVPTPASAQNGSSQVRLLEAFSLTSVQDLNFGRITVTGAAGTVSINANTSERTVTGGVVEAGGTPTRGEFVGVGNRNRLVAINRQAFPVLTRVGGTETLTAEPLFADNSWQLRTIRGQTRLSKRIGADNLVTLGIGSTIAIPADAVGGIYTGEYTLTIEYF